MVNEVEEKTQQVEELQTVDDDTKTVIEEVKLEFNEKIKKLMQSGKLKKATDVEKLKRIPSYVFSFDFLTQGGIPEGKFTLFFGDKSTGKSTFALRLIKSFLLSNPNRFACYFDFEDTFSVDWAKKILGDENLLNRLLVAKPQFAEEGIEIFHELINEYKDYEIGFYVIDSIASMITSSEAESDGEQVFVGQIARTANKFLRKMLPYTIDASRHGKPVTVLLINQIRYSFGMMRFTQEIKPGGKYQEAMASMEIKFFVDSMQKEKESGMPLTVEYKFVIEKNKVGGTPKVIGKYLMSIVDTEDMQSGEIIDGPIMIQFMKKLSILTQEGSKWKIRLKDEVFDFKTQREIIEKIKTDLLFKKKLTDYIIEEGYKQLGLLLSMYK